jgi:hypothetical protein
VWVQVPPQLQLAFCKKAIINLKQKLMKKHILVKTKKEIFERNTTIRKVDWRLLGKNFFKACEYDEQTNILGISYVAYAIAKTRQWLNCPALPYIEAFTDKENLEIQQELQKLLCVSEMKRLIRAKQEIRFNNTEYGIEGAGKSLNEAIEAFIDNAVKSFVEDDIDPRGVKEEDREISFYNVEDCEVYLPKKYVNQIWDEIEYRFGEEIKSVYNFSIDEATKAERIWEMSEGR